MDKLMEVLNTCGGAAGTIITLTTLFTLMSKKPIQWVEKIVDKSVKLSNDKIQESFDKIDSKLEAYRESSLAALRHEITEIYDTFLPLGYLPTNIKKDLISLYEAYEKNGGNSYVKEMYNELKTLPSRESN